MSGPEVSVVVLAYDGRDVIGDCIRSLAASRDVSLDLIVVDNASTDGSAQLVRDVIPDARIVQNDVNIGFAAGCNVGIRESTAAFVLLLNQDATVEPQAIRRLLDAVHADDAIASCAPKILFHEPPDVINSAGILLRPDGHGISRGRGEPDRGQLDEPRDVLGAHGACALFRRSAIERVGLFDEDFFAYNEELDLAWRLALAGYRCRYEPRAVARHREAHSSRRDPDRILFLMERNRIWTVVKNMGLGAAARHLPRLVACEVEALRHCAGVRTLVPLRARIDAVRGLVQALRKRRVVQALRTVDDAALERWYV